MKSTDVVLSIGIVVIAVGFLTIWRQLVLNHRDDVYLRFEQEMRALEAQNADTVNIEKLCYIESMAIGRWKPLEAAKLLHRGEALNEAERVLKQH